MADVGGCSIDDRRRVLADATRLTGVVELASRRRFCSEANCKTAVCYKLAPTERAKEARYQPGAIGPASAVVHGFHRLWLKLFLPPVEAFL